MPGLAFNDIVQVTFDYLHHGAQLMNVLHFRVVTPDPVGTVATQTQKIADYFGDAANPGSAAAKILSITPMTCMLRQVRAQNIAPIRYAYRTKDVYQNGVLETSKTPNIDIVVTKRTDVTGDGMQSGFFLPGVPNDKFDNGLISDAMFDLVQAKTDFLDRLTPVDDSDIVLTPVIFHRINGTFTDITAHQVHQTVRVMNRRTVGFGI